DIVCGRSPKTPKIHRDACRIKHPLSAIVLVEAAVVVVYAVSADFQDVAGATPPDAHADAITTVRLGVVDGSSIKVADNHTPTSSPNIQRPRSPQPKLTCCRHLCDHGPRSPIKT